MTAGLARQTPASCPSAPRRLARQRAEKSGRFAETLAALWLMAKGYRILAQRARTPWGEVDIAALKGDLLVFVEVKARRTHGAGIEAVSAWSRGRIIQAAQMLAGRWRLTHLRQRYDILVAAPFSAPLHLRDAWREGDRD
jgi:putative endonuclease